MKSMSNEYNRNTKKTWYNVDSSHENRPQIWNAIYKDWKPEHERPSCSIVNLLGISGTIETESAALLSASAIDYDFNGDFKQDVLDEVSHYASNWSIDEDEKKIRTNLTNQCIFSIDPTTARDLDDALSIDQIGKNKYRVGIHIADVAHFVQPNTKLDKEAQHRATSVYLVQKVLPMLPRILCEQLCSLNPGVKRLAMTVYITIDNHGKKIGKAEFHQSIINSCIKLDYLTAQRLMDCKQDENNVYIIPDDIINSYEIHGNFSWQDICHKCQLLNMIAKNKRKIRYNTGALELDNPSFKFQLDNQGHPIAAKHYPIYDSNHMIEEFMLLANCTVAEYIANAIPQLALLRKHPPPIQRLLDDIWKRMAILDEQLHVNYSAKANTIKVGTITPAGLIHKILSKYRNINLPNSSIKASIILDKLLAGPMNPAEYFCTGENYNKQDDINQIKLSWRHYALNFQYYTHFTSPIRRYPDVIVHRLLKSLMNYKQSNTKVKKLKYIQQHLQMNIDDIIKHAKHSNMRKENAKKASLMSEKTFLCLYIQRLLTKQQQQQQQDDDDDNNEAQEEKQKETKLLKYQAVITDFGKKTFKVYCLDLIEEQLVNLDDIDCKECFINTEQTTLTIIWHNNQQEMFNLFNICTIDVKCSYGPPLSVMFRFSKKE